MMSREDVKKATSLYFLLNPNETQKNKKEAIDLVMSTKGSVVPKGSLVNIIIYLLKENERLENEISKEKRIK